MVSILFFLQNPINFFPTSEQTPLISHLKKGYYDYRKSKITKIVHFEENTKRMSK